MRVTALVLLGVATASLAVLAWSQVLEAPEAAVMGDVEVVWCDANRPLVALAAETLGLLPGDLTNRNVNLQGDDPEDDSVDLTGLSALSALRRFRSVAQDVPPDLFADIGFPTEQEFESWSVLGPRAHGAAIAIVGEWLERLGGGWDHPDASRACLSAAAAFR